VKKIAIIGGGVAGLSIGWRLASEGAHVTLFERSLAGRATSWAAAGMLAATAETGKEDDDHARLARAGLKAWPEFSAAIEKASGSTIHYRRCGALLIATSDIHARHLRETAEALSSRGENAAWLNADDAVKVEPLLTSEMKGALHAPDDAQVDNRALGQALTRAFLKAGGTLHEHAEVEKLEMTKDRVSGVVVSGHVHPADDVVIAAGAWSSLVPGDVLFPEVRPAKGQMTALAPNPGARMPSSLLWGEETVYLVPRSETLLVGATVEDAGFETSVARETRDMLLARAIRLVPSLASWTPAESWAGLRPRTADDAPLIGATKLPGLYVASGQYRNGILFAPIMADLMARLLTEGLSGKVEGVDAHRFAPA